MKVAAVVWVLVASPDSWDAQQIMHSIYSTQAECLHQAVTERVTDVRLHQHWDWQCKRMRVSK